MPISKLDPVAALVVIDLQKGVLTIPTEPPTSLVLERSAKLAAAFRAKTLPVVLVTVSGRAPGRTSNATSFTPPPGWDELAPELGATPADVRITKFNIGAFTGTSLDLQLRRRGVTQLFFTGVATSSGVEATARVGYDLGYNIVSISDAMSDRDPVAHRHAIDVQLKKIGEVATTDEVLALLG